MLIASLLLSLWAGIISPALATARATAPLANNSPAKTAEAKTVEKLTWSDSRRLTWDDFKGAPETGNPHHALTAANLAVDAKCTSNAFSYDVKCVFLPEESWSKNKKSASLLKHEQLHFDLTEVHARQLRKKLKELGSSCSNLKGNLSTTVSTAFKDWKAEQDLFDKSCSHGLNKQEEAAWAENINQRLNELQAYR
ncbi:hypothetical protein ABID22_001656 [Pontibacter aydingkolensis]|uniref:DUF922 domain-containing Zn-dependent protease n=1 Tax=Pontibacter aydingkolensis TaxID=1911536 RepID=A0ABS7CU78_9BACT|nr:DUF922 domain-containing protein [Pontibacter aydingkolensis]MBW7467323.1 DUF922 domain-containing Zn-dependent protease [Pontibacter aydingkolensis]